MKPAYVCLVAAAAMLVSPISWADEATNSATGALSPGSAAGVQKAQDEGSILGVDLVEAGLVLAAAAGIAIAAGTKGSTSTSTTTTAP